MPIIKKAKNIPDIIQFLSSDINLDININNTLWAVEEGADSEDSRGRLVSFFGYEGDGDVVIAWEEVPIDHRRRRVSSTLSLIYYLKNIYSENIDFIQYL